MCYALHDFDPGSYTQQFTQKPYMEGIIHILWVGIC